MIDMIKQAYETVARRGLKLSLFCLALVSARARVRVRAGSGLGGRILTLTSI